MKRDLSKFPLTPSERDAYNRTGTFLTFALGKFSKTFDGRHVWLFTCFILLIDLILLLRLGNGG